MRAPPRSALWHVVTREAERKARGRGESVQAGFVIEACGLSDRMLTLSRVLLARSEKARVELSWAEGRRRLAAGESPGRRRDEFLIREWAHELGSEDHGMLSQIDGAVSGSTMRQDSVF
eukprot:7391293-Prymnesium_polylepis.1